ncbi:unnamed protein product, partial [Pylaiella littoralis]
LNLRREALPFCFTVRFCFQRSLHPCISSSVCLPRFVYTRSISERPPCCRIAWGVSISIWFTSDVGGSSHLSIHGPEDAGERGRPWSGFVEGAHDVYSQQYRHRCRHGV